jgi:parvulin-like peptidyl-prolyl isomerase
MRLALLLLQTSLFGAHPCLDSAPPEVRAARHVLVLHREVEHVDPSVTRSREEALEMASRISARARAGEDFDALVREISEAPTRLSGGVLGTYAPGVLEDALDRFLFAAASGEISEALDAPSGVHVLQRIEAHAGVLQIQIGDTSDAGRARAEDVVRRLTAGEDFSALARELSEDPGSRAHGGQYAVFERGPRDTLLKAEAFRMSVGVTDGPFATPLGWHVLRRVPPEEIDRELWEVRFVRLRAIVLAHEESEGLPPFPGRTRDAAAELARDLRARIAAGADMAELARELDDDPGGRERGGDLGWLHRSTPGLPAWIARAWLEKVGWLSEVVSTPAGFVILRRER